MLSCQGEICICILFVISYCRPSNTYNEKKLRQSCRAEDGFLLCPDGSCQLKRDLLQDLCLYGINCTNDEFRCRGLGRCVPRSYVGTENGCILGKKGVTRLPCKSDEFVCTESRLCVPRQAVRDGKPDCITKNITDHSDELIPLTTCTVETEFRCQDSSQRCIPREWVMDGAKDCVSNSDELRPLGSCNENEFRCENGRCITRYRVLDGYADCQHASDELGVLRLTYKCLNHEFYCHESGRCIPRAWVGDGITHCNDSSDENQVNFSCAEAEFTCANKLRCLPMIYVCDGMDHCGDCSDEIEACDEPRMWRCRNDTSKCIPQSFGCDGFPDCPGGYDNPEYLPGFKCTKTVLGTNETQCVIPQWTLHDNFSMCEDKSDICFRNGSFTCSRCLSDRSIIAQKQVCNGFIDCHDLSDECLCNGLRSNGVDISKFCQFICYSSLPSQACQKCRRRQLYCPLDKKCVTLDRICDGLIDCPLSKFDEKICVSDTVPTVMPSPTKDFECRKLDAAVMQYIRVLNVYETYVALFRANATKCNGIVECARFEDECNDECESTPEECDTFPLISVIPTALSTGIPFRVCNDYKRWRYDYTNFILPQSICNGVKECPDGEDERNCSGKFECKAGRVELPTGAIKDRISIEDSKRCDLVVDCIDQSDEMNCNSSTHFYCAHGNPLFIKASKVIDGRQDCTDNSDECPPDVFEDNPLSSRENMIANPFLRGFVWVMAFVATIGNLTVIIETVVFTKSNEESPISQCNRAIITSLAAADSLMGIALFVIASVSESTSGKYCDNDKSWRVSSTCNAIGVLTVLSSECSVFCLVVLTCYRIYGVFNPFKSRNLNPKRAYLLLSFLWVAALLVSIFPLIPDANHTMVTDVLIAPSEYFGNTVVPWKDFQQFAGRLHTLVQRGDNGSESDLSTWSGVIASMKSLYPDVLPQVEGYFGYYSTHGVCIPRLFRLAGTESLHPLSLFVISFNFICLMFIITAYCVIYWKSNRKTVQSDNASRTHRSNAMQKKITLLIATDLCCWLPICIMTFMTQNGTYMSKTAYAFAAIILLPINSSLNPVIYSGGFAQTRDRIFKSKCNRSSE